MRVHNEDEEGHIKNISYNIVHDVSVRCICIYIYIYIYMNTCTDSTRVEERRGEERRGEEGRKDDALVGWLVGSLLGL